MATGGPLPYLSVSGVEVANAARTLSYLRNGLGETLQGHWELGAGQLCDILYRTPGTPAVFVSPAHDPAPWYDPAEPGSATFLGFVLLDLKGYDSTIYRPLTNRTQGLGGATFSQQQRYPRVWKFRAAMISSDDAGAEYGLRWLTHALETTECDQCATGNLTVRLVCPPANGSNDTLGEWVSYDVVLTEGPTEVEPYSPRSQSEDTDVLAGCRDYVIVEFTLTAGNPFLYKPAHTASYFTLTQATTCVDICSFLFGSSIPVCTPVTVPKRGVLGTIITLETTDGFGSVLLQMYRSCGGSSEVPVGTPDLQIQLSGVPASSVVVVDSAQHKITVYTTLADGSVAVGDGTYLVQLATNQAIQWLEVANCDDLACVCVGASTPCEPGTVAVTVQTQVREG